MVRDPPPDHGVSILGGDQYPKLKTSPLLDHQQLFITPFSEPIPILLGSHHQKPNREIHAQYYYNYKTNGILRRSLWTAPPIGMLKKNEKLGKGVRFPAIPQGHYHGVCDGSFNLKKERGGQGGAVSNHRAIIFLTVSGKSMFCKSALFHEFEAMEILLEESVERGFFELWLFTDCRRAVDMIRESNWRNASWETATALAAESDDPEVFEILSRINSFIWKNYTSKPGRFVEIGFSEREATYVADDLSKAFTGDRGKKIVKDCVQYDSHGVRQDNSGKILRTNSLSETSDFFEYRYHCGVGSVDLSKQGRTMSFIINIVSDLGFNIFHFRD